MRGRRCSIGGGALKLRDGSNVRGGVGCVPVRTACGALPSPRCRPLGVGGGEGVG